MWSASVVFVAVALLAAARGGLGQSPSSSPVCHVLCAAVDLNGSDIDYISLNGAVTECTYLSGGTCSYDLSGTLVHDGNDGACPTVAERNCTSKRFNIIAALADRRRRAAARPRTVVPDLDKLRRGASR